MTPSENITVIAKDFRWEMGHRLPYHRGLCRNIHGHSYRMRLAVEGIPDEHGMVMDYFDMAQIADPIIAELDHAFLCDQDDGIMLDLLGAHNMKHVVVPFHTTAENLAAWLLVRLADQLRQHSNITTITVRVCETERTHAERSMKLTEK